jgi:hypothetical protein
VAAGLERRGDRVARRVVVEGPRRGDGDDRGPERLDIVGVVVVVVV